MTDLQCTARGATHIDAASKHLDPTRVQVVMVKIPIGGGAFARTKFVYVHFVGPSAPAVKRAKWNSKVEGALKRLQPLHGGFETGTIGDATMGPIVTRMKKVFVSDNIDVDMSKLLAEINERLKECVKETDDASSDGEDVDEEDATEGRIAEEPANPAATAALRTVTRACEKGTESAAVLSGIADDAGPFNWALFTVQGTVKSGAPVTLQELDLLNAGSGGAVEMLTELRLDNDRKHKDGIMYGLLRLSFGTGRFRRVKRFFVHFIGTDVGGVKRARSLQEQSRHAAAALGHNGALSLMFVDPQADMNLSAIVDKSKQYFVVDQIENPSSPVAKKLARFQQAQQSNGGGGGNEKQQTAPTGGSSTAAETEVNKKEEAQKEDDKKAAQEITAAAYLEALREEQEAAEAYFKKKQQELEEEKRKKQQQPVSPKSPGSPRRHNYNVDETVKRVHSDGEGSLQWAVFSIA